MRRVEIGPGGDIELMEGLVMHGCWSPGIVRVDPKFWLRVGNWLLGGNKADLRALLNGSWAEGCTARQSGVASRQTKTSASAPGGEAPEGA